MNNKKNNNNTINNFEKEKIVMEKTFDEIKNEFIEASLEEKIKIYTSAENLTVEQFKELLAYYPIKHLEKLEKAVNSK